jgi:hypothetical protein
MKPSNTRPLAATEKGTAFRRSGRSDLNWIVSVQTERVVGKDNTVAIREWLWQIDKTRFRHSLAGTTVTIHEHLDETVSIRYGPIWWGVITRRKRSWRIRARKSAVEKAGAWKPGKTKSRFSPAPTAGSGQNQDQTQGGLKAASLCFTKRANHELIKADNLTC